MRQAGSALIFLSFYLLIAPKRVYAYLDPGSGSFIFQLLIGALFGVSFAIKIYWRKIKNFFLNFFSRQRKRKKNND